MALGPALSVSALTFNAHLFGHGAEFFVGGTRRETGFYFHDTERLPQIVHSVREANADLVGLTEVWGENDQRRIQQDLRHVYPYAVLTPSAPGIGRLIEKTYGDWPRLGRALFGRPDRSEGDGVVSIFTRRHYSAAKGSLGTGRHRYLSEDVIGRTLSSLLRSGPVWGAGMMFLSKLPIETSFFLPHRLKADWEHMADKGVLWTTVRLPEGRRIRVAVAHLQEGVSPEAMAARRDQVRKIKKTADSLGDPSLVLGDLNVVGETLEHAWMLSALEMFDAGREPTYRDPNPYQAKLRAPATPVPVERRLDYIMGSPHWRMAGTWVPRDLFRAVEGYFLSDHDPVFAQAVLED